MFLRCALPVYLVVVAPVVFDQFSVRASLGQGPPASCSPHPSSSSARIRAPRESDVTGAFPSVFFLYLRQYLSFLLSSLRGLGHGVKQHLFAVHRARLFPRSLSERRRFSELWRMITQSRGINHRPFTVGAAVDRSLSRGRAFVRFSGRTSASRWRMRAATILAIVTPANQRARLTRRRRDTGANSEPNNARAVRGSKTVFMSFPARLPEERSRAVP